MADPKRGARILQDELEKAKESLKDVDDNIRKLTGRDPQESRPVSRRVSAVTDSRGRERLYMQARWGPDEDSPTPNRRRVVGGPGPFSRLGPSPRMFGGRGRPRGQDSGDEDELPNKPAIQSSVVATPKEARSRKDSIDEQTKDQKGTARNKRMFGLLLGTLRKFKDEAKETRDKEDQRKQIELKLEEKAKMEKEDLQRERKQLFLERKEKQARIRRLEYKVELVEMHEAWEKETRKLNNFIRTKAKPCIFYLPKMMNSALESKLKDTAKFVEEMIAERQKKIQSEIADLMSNPDMDDVEEGEEEGEGETAQPGKENRVGRRRSGESESRRRSSESHRNGDVDRKRRKSESIGDEESGAGKYRRRSKEDEGHRSGGSNRRSHRKDDKPKDKNEPRVEISYNDGEEEDDDVKQDSDKRQVYNTEENVDASEKVDSSQTSLKLDSLQDLHSSQKVSEMEQDVDNEAKQGQTSQAEDEEEGEVQDSVDE